MVNNSRTTDWLFPTKIKIKNTTVPKYYLKKYCVLQTDQNPLIFNKTVNYIQIKKKLIATIKIFQYKEFIKK